MSLTKDRIISLATLARRVTVTREGAKVILKGQGDDGAGVLDLFENMRAQLVATADLLIEADEAEAALEAKAEADTGGEA